MPIKKLLCEICTMEIGSFDTNEISYPIKSEMFKAIDDDRDFVPPFPEGLTWEWMRCPMCQNLPFRIVLERFDDVDRPDVPEYLLTEDGKWSINTRKIKREDLKPLTAKDKNGYPCPYCKGHFSRDYYLKRHIINYCRALSGTDREEIVKQLGIA